MRVAVVTHYFPTSVDPWAGHSAFQTLRLLAAKCDLHVFYPYSVYPFNLAPPKRRGIEPDPSWRPGEVDVAYIPYPALPLITRPLNGASIARKLLPHVRAWHPDLILNYVVYPNGYAAVRIAESLGIPAVLTAIGSDLNRIAPGCERPTRYALTHANAVVTVSQALADAALRLGAPPASTQAILNGCNTSLFHPGDLNARTEARRALNLDPEAEMALYIGRFDLRKGLLELIEALASLRGTRPRLHTYLIGSGPDRPALDEAIARHRLIAHTTFVPPQGTAQIARWMAAADLVTLPSYMEGCPNVVVEALSAGRPVVATAVGGIPELMDETCGALVPSRDAAALADGLTHTLDTPWNATAISARRSRSWQDVADDLWAVLERASASHHHPNEGSRYSDLASSTGSMSTSTWRLCPPPPRMSPRKGLTSP